LKIQNQIKKNLGTKTQPDSGFRLSVTNVEEQGILGSFARLPQAEREIVRQLLDKFGSQGVAAIRFPVPFGYCALAPEKTIDAEPSLEAA
jgi:hypothetical protein